MCICMPLYAVTYCYMPLHTVTRRRTRCWATRIFADDTTLARMWTIRTPGSSSSTTPSAAAAFLGVASGAVGSASTFRAASRHPQQTLQPEGCRLPALLWTVEFEVCECARPAAGTAAHTRAGAVVALLYRVRLRGSRWHRCAGSDQVPGEGERMGRFSYIVGGRSMDECGGCNAFSGSREKIGGVDKSRQCLIIQGHVARV